MSDELNDIASPPLADVEPADPTTKAAEAVSLNNFFADMKSRHFIFVPARELWPASSVDARIPPLLEGGKSVPASKWLAKNRPVEQMTWAPGLPTVIEDRLIAEGGWIEHRGAKIFNLYRPPTIELGDPKKADLWIEHISNVFPNEANHIIRWLAHRRQRPQEKPNHAIVLGGKQGVGKDTILEPVKRAIGPWNFCEVSPKQMLGRFNGFARSVILRVSEARDLGDVDRFAFYDHLKVYTAAPPDVLRVDEKNLREYSLPNCCGVIITTNYKTDGIYLPADDRRHLVAWSDLSKEDFTAAYWNRLYGWYETGGYQHVGAYLDALDISQFDPKAPPPQTSAFWEIVDAGRAPEDAELDDLLDKMGRPDAIQLSKLIGAAQGELGEWMRDRRNRRTIPHRMESCGYAPVRNDTAKDGLWKTGGRRETIYGKADLTVSKRLAAARGLIKGTLLVE
ncbi:hypothetical protein ACVME8_007686 [Bradyrhizobium diazoefficiens]